MEKIIVESCGSLRAVKCFGHFKDKEGMSLGLDCQDATGNRWAANPGQVRDGDWDSVLKEELDFNEALRKNRKGIGQVTVSYKGTGFTNAQNSFNRG